MLNHVEQRTFTAYNGSSLADISRIRDLNARFNCFNDLLKEHQFKNRTVDLNQRGAALKLTLYQFTKLIT